jgi:hypothetical protein
VVIIKFALFFFLIMMVWMATLRQSMVTPYGGPFYFADLEGTSNPVQPKYRLNFTQAWHSDRYVEVYFSEAGVPVLARHMAAHQVAWQMVWIYNKNGELTRRYTEDAAGNLLKIDVTPAANPTPTESPTPGF